MFGSTMLLFTNRFIFSFAWSLFIVFEKIILNLPWPVKNYFISQFRDEYLAQRSVLNSKTV
jgi:hypothetical protein